MPAYRSVIFDCDSTLSALEGIDELAGPRRAEIAALTGRAMRGELPLEDVYSLRLDLVRPTRDAVLDLGERYVSALVPGARAVVAGLRAEGIQVRIVSGGLRLAVLRLAREVGVGEAFVDAVDIFFNEDGTYAGFDQACPLARSGGKLAIAERWGASLLRPAMMVGDGITDAEVRPAVDLFVAFAGVASRHDVVAAADLVVEGLSLAPVFSLAMGDDVPREPGRRSLYMEGRPTLSGRIDR